MAVIVSEETGRISVAHNGRLVRDLDQERLRRILRTLLRLDRQSASQHSERRPPPGPRPPARGQSPERRADDAAKSSAHVG